MTAILILTVGLFLVCAAAYAVEPKTADGDADAVDEKEQQALALDFFKEWGPYHEQQIERAFLIANKAAIKVLRMKKRIQGGDISAEPDQPWGADCCAPSLPSSHPINMVARLHTDRRGNETKGDPAKVNAVADHIKKNPLPCADLDSEKDQDTMDKVAEYVRKFNAKFPLLSWDYSRICLAATIFPHYVPGAKAAA